MKWLLCDYGQVLCLPPTDADRRAIESAAGATGERLWRAYWEHRPAYDRGDLDAASYWRAVLGTEPAPAELQTLLEADAASWLKPNCDALAGARRAAKRGLRLAVLSNAPLAQADLFDGLGWLADFSPRLFSSRIGAVKPEPRAYLVALEALGADAEDVIFVDDREVNVKAARDVGMRALLFRDPGQFDEIEPR